MEVAPTISELFPNSTNTSSPAKGSNELGQEDFMRLMVAQLENQDPTKPMDNFEFLSQIAQFGTVDGIQGLKSEFSDISSVLYANQALDAAGLIGNKVVTDSNLGVLTEGETLSATIDLPQSAASVTLYIQNMAGRVVHSQPMGSATAGELKVDWNGIDDEGNPALPGQYRVSAEAVIGGQNQGVSAFTHGLVESVSSDRATGGVVLNLAGGEQMALSAVDRFL
ncbi:MAG: flagellar basal-body rod modification protein FlgD [Halioglobus sp.]|jgi:flagellar basal-body rod modification protein FlgD